MVGGYVVCCVIVFVLLPTDGTVAWREVGPALVLQVVIGVLLLFAMRMRSDHAFLGTLGVAAYLLSVALLRDGTEPASGFGPLVLVPVVFASLRANRREFAVALFGVAAVYLLPVWLVGAPQYPVGGWRSGLLFLVLSAVLGTALLQLVGRVGELLDELGRIARSDALTGLPNRRAWDEFLERQMAIARRTGEPLTVAMIDLDGFKAYNDAHGHLAGDRLLRAACTAWRTVLRESDVLARWGGDEFALLLPGCDANATEALVERIRESYPGISFAAGIAPWALHTPAESLLAGADNALYRAKAKHGSRAFATALAEL